MVIIKIHFMNLSNTHKPSSAASHKVAQNTLKYFLKSAENYLIMIDNIMDKKYLSQIGKKCAILDEQLHFQKFNSINSNKSSRRTRTRTV